MDDLDLAPVDGDRRAATLFETASLSRLFSELSLVVLGKHIEICSREGSSLVFTEVERLGVVSRDLLEESWSFCFELFSLEVFDCVCEEPTDDENTDAAEAIAE